MPSTYSRVSRLWTHGFLNWMLCKCRQILLLSFFFFIFRYLFCFVLFVHDFTHRYRVNSIKRCQLVSVDIRWRIDVHCAIFIFSPKAKSKTRSICPLLNFSLFLNCYSNEKNVCDQRNNISFGMVFFFSISSSNF